jgi:hypothetical protein
MKFVGVRLAQKAARSTDQSECHKAACRARAEGEEMTNRDIPFAPFLLACS